MIPALVLGNGLSALGVARTLRRAGIPAYLHDANPGIEVGSRWYRPAPLCHSPPRANHLADLLSALALDRAVLLPCSDDWARQVSACPDEFRDRFPASIASPETMDILVDKAQLAHHLDRLGVPHPVTVLLDGPEGLALLPSRVFEGAFLKPHDSQRFFARFGVKGMQVASREDAVERLTRIQEAGLKVLLQQYVPGPGSLHYFVDGFMDRNGSMTGVLARRRLRMYPLDFGNSSFVVTVPPEEAADAIESLRTLLGDLGFRGIFSAEFKRDPRDGLFRLIEVNARAWWYVEFTARSGVDVCTMAYRDALEEPVPVASAYRVGARLVYPYYDFFACREDPDRGDPSIPRGYRAWIGAQQPLFNWSDPWPALREFGALTRRISRGVPPRKADVPHRNGGSPRRVPKGTPSS
jgi:D-aspartate ligase